ncbi:MAG: hypothetical protein ACLQUY_16355 [Ktedonobacterales bacterium]
MLNDHLKAVMERAAQLPAPVQDELAQLVEEALAHLTQPGPRLSPEWRGSVERAMREQAETLEYLKDK